MPQTYITTSQNQTIQDLLREIGLSADDLKHFWDLAGTPKTRDAANRMIAILTIKTIFKRMGYDSDKQSEFITDTLGYFKPVEELPTREVGQIHKALKIKEARLNTPAVAPFMVATFKVDSTTVHADQLSAIKHCDFYEARDVLKILFIDGQAARLSVGGIEFQAVDYRGDWR